MHFTVVLLQRTNYIQFESLSYLRVFGLYIGLVSKNRIQIPQNDAILLGGVCRSYNLHLYGRLCHFFCLVPAKDEEKKKMQKANTELLAEKRRLEEKVKCLTESLTVSWVAMT